MTLMLFGASMMQNDYRAVAAAHAVCCNRPQEELFYLADKVTPLHQHSALSPVIIRLILVTLEIVWNNVEAA